VDAIERLQADPRAPSVLAFLDPSAAGAFALAMAHQTIRDSERLTKLSEGSCDLDDSMASSNASSRCR
jgi:hypothetical protein